jgi:hypothetical protein
VSPGLGLLPRLAGATALTVALLFEGRAVAQPAPLPAPTAPVVIAPKLQSDPAVNYPEGGKGDATVVLILTINPDGTVRQAVPETPQEPFSSQAVGAALGWRFDPAIRNGVPIAAKIRFEIVFHAPVATAPEPPEANPYDEPPAAQKPEPRGAVQEVTIRGERPEPSRSVTLSRAEVRQIPGTFGDPFRAIEIMPGVTPIVSGLPFFFIRGAPPGDVGYFLDGIRVPLLFHVGVGPSVIHPALMDRVDLYPGGYPARFGRFSGGIVSGETIAPRPETHGEYNVRLFDAGALAETSFDGERGTVLLGGRYSYTAALLSQLSPNVELDYWDYQARVTYDLSRDEQIGAFAFGSYDYLGQQTPGDATLTLFGAEFYRVDLRYDRRLEGGGSVRLGLMGGIDRSRLPQDRFLRDRLGGLRSEITYPLGEKVLLRGGTDVELDSYDVELNAADLGPQSSRATTLFPTRTDIQGSARADVVLKIDPRLDVTPGLRADFFASEGATAGSFDPRLATRLEVTDRMRLLSSMGIAHQLPAFVLPLPGFQPGGIKGGLQEALQESMGVELELGGDTTATATVFHNGFFNLSDPLGTNPPAVSGCPPGSFPDGAVLGDRGGQPGGNGSCKLPGNFQPGQVNSDRSGGGGQGADTNGTNNVSNVLEARTSGNAYGLELFLKRKLTSNLGGFLSYTLSRSTRSYGDRVYTASFDRTHVLNAALAYNLGRNWRAGTRLVFYTGLPKAPDPTDPDSTRLPPFFRVDLRLEKRWDLGKKWWISFVAEWMNATLSKEAISTTCNLQGCQAQEIGPVTVPSVGVEGGF